MNRRALLGLIALAGCAGPGFNAPDPVQLPRDSVEGAGDPTRAAVSRASFAFTNQAGLAGQPGLAARAIADMEFIAAALPFDPRYQQRDSLLSPQLAIGRTEWRRVLGIAPQQPAQPVIDSLYAVARAMAVGDTAAAASALRPGLFNPDGAAALALLGALPPLPDTARAAIAAQRVQMEPNLPVGRRRL